MYQKLLKNIKYAVFDCFIKQLSNICKICHHQSYIR